MQSFSVDHQSKVPLYKQLVDHIASQIETGSLKAGTKLPSSRQLSAILNVSRWTTSYAFQELYRLGYIRNVVGSGSFVSVVMPQTRFDPDVRNVADESFMSDEEMSAYAQRLVEYCPNEVQSESSLSCVDTPSLSKWNAARRKASKSLDRVRTAGRAPFGCPLLRRQIAEYLNRRHQISCSIDQLCIFPSLTLAVENIARFLLEPGDGVVTEDPSAESVLRILRAHGAFLHPVDVDDSGICTEEIDKIPSAKMMYVTPSCQYPLGATLSGPRRKELLDHARQKQMLIVESEPDFELFLGSSKLPRLIQADEGGKVIFLASLPKNCLGIPDYTVCIVPRRMAFAFQRFMGFFERERDYLTEAALTMFIEDGYWERWLGTIRGAMTARKRKVVEAVNHVLSKYARIKASSSGTRLCLIFDEQISEHMIAAAAEYSQLSISAGHKQFYVFDFASLDDDRIHSSIEEFAGMLGSGGVEECSVVSEVVGSPRVEMGIPQVGFSKVGGDALKLGAGGTPAPPG
jgi:GntR family transcriptional regulator / MocR family aminotransferase